MAKSGVLSAMTFMLENLGVCRKAVDLADDIAVLTQGFPRGFRFLVDQLNQRRFPSPRIWPKVMGGSRVQTGEHSSPWHEALCTSAFR